MKHKKEVDEFYRFLDRVERDPELRKRLEKKMKIIMPLVERDIKGGENTPPNEYTLFIP